MASRVPRGYYQAAGTIVAAADLPTAIGTAVPADYDAVEVQAEGQALRWRTDGTNPTAAVGSLIPVGTSVVFRRSQGNVLRLIAAAGGAIANITFFK